MQALEKDSLYIRFGIRNDTLYRISFKEDKDLPVQVIIGEVQNFDTNQMIIKIYRKDNTYDFCMLTRTNILSFVPYMSIAKWQAKNNPKVKYKRFWKEPFSAGYSFLSIHRQIREFRPSYATRPEWDGVHFYNKHGEYTILLKDGQIIHPKMEEIWDRNKHDWMLVTLTDEAVKLLKEAGEL